MAIPEYDFTVQTEQRRRRVHEGSPGEAEYIFTAVRAKETDFVYIDLLTRDGRLIAQLQYQTLGEREDEAHITMSINQEPPHDQQQMSVVVFGEGIETNQDDRISQTWSRGNVMTLQVHQLYQPGPDYQGEV